MSPTYNSNENLELIQVTDKDLIDFTRTQNSLAWKGILSSKDYVLREIVLGKSKIASEGDNNLYVFQLKDVNTDKPKCSIELLVRQSLRFQYNESTKKVETKNIMSGTIGAVFTPPENRGKGYARIMVDKLVDIAKNQYLTDDGYIFLYSEVGEFYSKNGFKTFGIDLIKIDFDQDLEFKIDSKIKHETIAFHQFEELMEKYKFKFISEIESEVAKDHKTRVSIDPTSHLIDWFHLRSKFVTHRTFESSEELKQDEFDFQNESYDAIREKFEKSQPEIFGIKTFDSNNDVNGFIVWTIDWSENKLQNNATILKIVAFDDDEDIRINLVKLTFQYLKNNSIYGKTTSTLCIWESEVSSNLKEYLVGHFKAKSGLENPSISAILMCDPKEDKELKDGKLIWEENTKLPWF
ncbi:uncharacterized protein KGF55_001275 [Candida pseudojiufengensis]|uniref:uncharacterized protein n=1 Tax=Candida pseudojiufengensis TaxID=497109 RepID=UPI002224A20F|nr:uncharacterized protein KGF55_001275 [Candida pseudojiufengensis]KAI5965911.1 hypothetical protein KGF55_001275 [Candida pseudojiufengensis]